MRENGSPPPQFEFDEDHSYFMVRLPVHRLARPPVTTFRTEQVTPQVGDQVRGQVSDQVGDQVGDQVARLILVVQGEMGRRALQAALGVQSPRYFREAYILPALSAGLLEMTIPNSPNSRLQKYRLTQKGRTWLAAHGKGRGPDLSRTH